MNIDEDKTIAEKTQNIQNRLLDGITELCRQAEEELKAIHRRIKNE